MYGHFRGYSSSVYRWGCNTFSVDEYKDMLVTVSGILSGPLGFIVGYYFKASKE